MNDIIKLLPDSVANQIAAGEVIQRPASVIKELVENSVDAGATEIRIFIKDAGRTLIQVIDNGKGMSETDARMAFERHATSKITAASDLYTLHTMGFRGEALPSICAIAQVELRTRTADANIGTKIVINGSNLEVQEPCMCEVGSNFMVKNIFYNVRARRKFLKSDSVELANIMREFERLALVNYDKHLSIDTGSRTIDLRQATFKQRISDIWKNNLNMQLVPVEVDTSMVKISGFISRPEYARRRNPLQYLIVNGRNMRHPYFHKAIVSCFENLIAADTQPCYFIRFDVDPETIDVNVHPTKNEIKFEYEQEIWRILSVAVKSALGKFSAVPSIDFTTESVPVHIVNPGDYVEAPSLELDPSYSPFSAPQPNVFDRSNRVPSLPHTTERKVPADWDRLYSDFIASTSDSASSVVPSHPTLIGNDETQESTPICIQFALKYIITPSREGLLVIDQHRAHVKILYENFLAKAKMPEAVAQHVIFADLLTLDPAQQLVLEGAEKEITRLGFKLEYEEDNKWRITAVPASLKTGDPRDMIIRIIESISDDSANYGNEGKPADTLLERVALVMARSSAIEGGQRLSSSEMEHLISELFRLPDPNFSPNGNPIVRVIDENRIQSLFL
jgi:DNA mismatch repair protein MutL